MKFLNKIKNQIRYSLGRKISDPIFYIHKLRRGDVAIDCGANVGKITQKMLLQGAEVYAFEPNPFAFEELSKRVSSNKKAHCINKGVYDKNTSMPLYLHRQAGEDQIKWSVGSSLLPTKGNVSPDDFVEAELIDLAEFINSFNKKIKLIKMDIEGAEIPVIEKLIDTGTIKKIKWLVAEAHDQRIPELKDAMEKLKAKIKKNKIKNINFNWE